MIGSAIKKYAAAHGMTCDGGLAYGKVNGFHISLEDGSGVKILQIYLYPPTTPMESDSEDLIRVQQLLMDCKLQDYRLVKQNPVQVGAGRAVISFSDSIGTMDRVERYIDEMLPRLAEVCVSADACACCGRRMSETAYTSLDGYLMPVHPECVGTLSAQVEQSVEPEKDGSVVRGILGALLGAIIGAIPWAIVFMMGYVASIVGLLIGYLSNFFYGKLGGKNSKARVVIVVIAVLLGVGLGQIAGNTALFVQSYQEAGGRENTAMTAPQFVMDCWNTYLCADQTVALERAYNMIVETEPSLKEQGLTREAFIQMNLSDSYDDLHDDAVREFASNLCIGVLFGILGCIGLFAQLHKNTEKRAVKALK